MSGAATVGRLIISLSADVAQLQTDVQKGVGIVDSATADMKAAAASAKNALVALWAAFSGNEVLHWAEGIVGSTAALAAFSEKTGSSVESLSKLANQARISGVDFGTLQNLTLKLAVGLANLDDETKASTKALEYLGISTRDPATALQEIAVDLDRYADGVGKAALAKDLFGRNGPEFLSYLHDLAQAHTALGTISTEQAQSAKELEESWRTLGVQGTILRDVLLSAVVPVLADAAQRMVLVRESGVGMFEGLLYGPNLPNVMQHLGDLNAQLLQTKAQADEVARGFLGIDNSMSQMVQHGVSQATAGLQQEIEKWAKLRDAYIGAWVKSLGYVGDAHDQMVGNSAASVSKLVANYSSASEAIKAADFTGPVAALQERLDALTGADGGYANLNKAILAIQAAQASGKVVTIETIAAYLALAGELDEATNQAKAYTVALKEWQEQEDTFNKARMNYKKVQNAAEEAEKNYAQAMQDTIDKSNDELAALGLSASAQRDLTAERKIDIATRTIVNKLIKDGREDLVAEAVQAGETAKAVVYANNQQADSVRTWKGVLDTASASVANFIVDFSEHGSAAFKNLWNNFKNWALQALAEIAAKQIVVSIVGALGIGGSAGAAAASGIANGIGGAGSILNGITGGGSGFGGAAASAISSIFGPSATTAALAGDAFLPGALFGGADAASAGGLLGGLGGASGILGTLGIIGGVAGLAALAAELFSSHGGPKVGGVAGTAAGLNQYSGETTSQGNQLAAQVHQAIQSDYNAFLQAAGITGNAQFGVSYDTDPQGTAQSRVSGAVTVGGKSVYNLTDLDVGRSEETLTSGLQLLGLREELAALQSTAGLSPAVLAILQKVDAQTASLEAATAAIKAAAAAIAAAKTAPTTPLIVTLDPSIPLAGNGPTYNFGGP